MDCNKESIESDFTHSDQPSKSDRELFRICPSKLTKRELEDLYFTVLETNLELRKTIRGQQDKLKLLSIKMQSVTLGSKLKGIEEKKDCSVSTKGLINQQRESVSDLKRANDRMTERIRLLNKKLASAKQISKLPLSTQKHVRNLPSTTACVTKCSTISMKRPCCETHNKITVSCQHPSRVYMDVNSAETQTESGTKKDSKMCDENKCKALMDELKQKIVNLEEELSNTHNKYSDRIRRLELEMQRCHDEGLQVPEPRTGYENDLQQREKHFKHLVDNLKAAESLSGELEKQLAIEKKKVAIMLSQLKTGNIADRLIQSIDPVTDVQTSTNYVAGGLDEWDGPTIICNCILHCFKTKSAKDSRLSMEKINLANCAETSKSIATDNTQLNDPNVLRNTPVANELKQNLLDPFEVQGLPNSNCKNTTGLNKRQDLPDDMNNETVTHDTRQSQEIYENNKNKTVADYNFNEIPSNNQNCNINDININKDLLDTGVTNNMHEVSQDQPNINKTTSPDATTRIRVSDPDSIPEAGSIGLPDLNNKNKLHKVRDSRELLYIKKSFEKLCNKIEDVQCNIQAFDAPDPVNSQGLLDTNKSSNVNNRDKEDKNQDLNNINWITTELLTLNACPCRLETCRQQCQICQKRRGTKDIRKSYNAKRQIQIPHPYKSEDLPPPDVTCDEHNTNTGECMHREFNKSHIRERKDFQNQFECDEGFNTSGANKNLLDPNVSHNANVSCDTQNVLDVTTDRVCAEVPDCMLKPEGSRDYKTHKRLESTDSRPDSNKLFNIRQGLSGTNNIYTARESQDQSEADRSHQMLSHPNRISISPVTNEEHNVNEVVNAEDQPEETANENQGDVKWLNSVIANAQKRRNTDENQYHGDDFYHTQLGTADPNFVTQSLQHINEEQMITISKLIAQAEMLKQARNGKSEATQAGTSKLHTDSSNAPVNLVPPNRDICDNSTLIHSDFQCVGPIANIDKKPNNVNETKTPSSKHDCHNSLQIPGPLPVSSLNHQDGNWKMHIFKHFARDNKKRNAKKNQRCSVDVLDSKNNENHKDIKSQGTSTVVENTTAEPENDKHCPEINKKCPENDKNSPENDKFPPENEKSFYGEQSNNPRNEPQSMKTLVTEPSTMSALTDCINNNLSKRLNVTEKETQAELKQDKLMKRSRDIDTPIQVPREVTTYRRKSGTLCFKTLPISERSENCHCDEKSPCGGEKPLGTQDAGTQNMSAVEQRFCTGCVSCKCNIIPCKPNETVRVPDPQADTSKNEDKCTNTPAKTCSKQSNNNSPSEREALPNNNPLNTDGNNKKPHEQCTMTTEAITSRNLEQALQTLSEELKRCKEMMLKQGSEKTPSDLKAEEHALKPGIAKHILSDISVPKCIFTLHIGTLVLSDEAVLNTRGKNMVLTWKFYDQNVAITRMHAGRVMLFDFSTEYEINITDDFLEYMRQEEMQIHICELEKQSQLFASCSLPLRDALLHTNRRADMSLALVAGPQMIVARSMNSATSDALDASDEMGVLDLWCMLRADVKLLPIINRAISCPSTKELPTNNDGNDILHTSSRVMQQVMDEDDSANEYNDVAMTLAKTQTKFEHSLEDLKPHPDNVHRWGSSILRLPSRDVNESEPPETNTQNQANTHQWPGIAGALLMQEPNQYYKHMSMSSRRDSSVLNLPNTVSIDHVTSTKPKQHGRHSRRYHATGQGNDPGPTRQARQPSKFLPQFLDQETADHWMDEMKPPKPLQEPSEYRPHLSDKAAGPWIPQPEIPTQYLPQPKYATGPWRNAMGMPTPEQEPIKYTKQSRDNATTSWMPPYPSQESNKPPPQSTSNAIDPSKKDASPPKSSEEKLTETDGQGIIINEVVANIKTPDDMKYAINLTNVANIKTPDDMKYAINLTNDLLSQTRSNTSSYKSALPRLKAKKVADRAKESLYATRASTKNNQDQKKFDQDPSIMLPLDRNEDVEIYRKYENISKLLGKGQSGSKGDLTKKQVTINAHDEYPQEVPQKEYTDYRSSSDEYQSVDITILWLALNEECEAMCNPHVQRVYVAYTFLGRSGADLETPVSLPKPKHYVDKCYFNFKKSFQLEKDDIPLLGHMGRCRAASKVFTNPRDCILFSVISEPPEDPLGLEVCEDIGYAHLYLGDLLAYSAGSQGYTEVVPVRAKSGHSVCGVLAVRVDGLDVLRQCVAMTSSQNKFLTVE